MDNKGQAPPSYQATTAEGIEYAQAQQMQQEHAQQTQQQYQQATGSSPAPQQQQQYPQSAGTSPAPQGHEGQSYPMQPMPVQQQQPPQQHQHQHQHQQYHDPQKQLPQQPQQQQPQPQQQPQYPPQQYTAPQGGYPTGPQPMPYQSLQTASMPVWCPQCNKTVNTVTTFEAGNFTHGVAVLLCCFTWCCCWIPYVFNGLQDVVHKCPTCPTTFAVFHRSGRTEVLVPPQAGPPQHQQPQPQPQPQQQFQPAPAPAQH